MAVSGKYMGVSNLGYFYASLSLMKSLLSIEKTKTQYS